MEIYYYCNVDSLLMHLSSFCVCVCVCVRVCVCVCVCCLWPAWNLYRSQFNYRILDIYMTLEEGLLVDSLYQYFIAAFEKVWSILCFVTAKFCFWLTEFHRNSLFVVQCLQVACQCQFRMGVRVSCQLPYNFTSMVSNYISHWLGILNYNLKSC